MNLEFYYVWISMIPNLGYVKLKQILKKYKLNTLEELYNYDGKEECFKIKYKILATSMYKRIIQRDIKIIHIEHEFYPLELKEIYCPPLVLYAKGNINLLKKKKIAVVGSREATTYGKKIAYVIGKKLAKKDVVVVSGLAKGIDEYSHIGASEIEEKTIAVIGTGLDICYPYKNRYLEKRIILKKGLILSEYLLGVGPQKWHFPMRNRIVAGLSNSLILVEAKKRSGALITVDMMLENGKEVYVVPPPEKSEKFEGNSDLIKDGANILVDLREF